MSPMILYTLKIAILINVIFIVNFWFFTQKSGVRNMNEKKIIKLVLIVYIYIVH